MSKNNYKVAAFLALLLIALPAGAQLESSYAHDHREPRSALLTSGGTQEGELIWSDWIRRHDARLCVGGSRDGTYGFPPGVQHDLNEKVRLRFFKKHRPDMINIRAYRIVVLNRPIGDGEDVSHVLRRVTLPNGRIVWDAVFRPFVAGDYYLDVIAEWRDRDCTGDLQKIRWTFHASTY